MPRLKAHEIRKDDELTPAQRDHVVDVICRWVERETAAAGRIPPA